MILNQPFSPRHERLSAHLLRAMLECAEGDPARVREVALAVERFLETDASLGPMLSDKVLLWMVAQALVAAGEEPLAEQWVQHALDPELGRLALSCLRHDEQGDLWRLLGLGVVRLVPCSFESGPIWIVDLSRVHVRGGHFYELSWVPAVRQLIRRVIGIWSRTGCCGLLAIRGARMLAQSLHSRPPETLRCARRIEIVCRETALQSAREYAGNGNLRVINLDAQWPRAVRARRWKPCSKTVACKATRFS